MRVFFILFLNILFLNPEAFTQDLQSERIRTIGDRKRSIYLESGIIHNGSTSVVTKLKSVRHNFSESLGYERLVFDFETPKVPRIYGYISATESKMYLDLFDTELAAAISSMGQSRFIESINFYPITEESLSVEVKFKEKVSVDIFYLESPGRFVVDIKK